LAIRKHTDKYCLDIPAEKEQYELLINNPDVSIIEEKMVTGQGATPRIYLVVKWFQYVID
jgi:hypothetical protein